MCPSPVLSSRRCVFWRCVFRRCASRAALTLCGIVALLAGCDGDNAADPPPRVALSPGELVASPIDEAALKQCVALLTELPEADRPAFSPALDAFDGSSLPSADLIAAHRRRYADAMNPALHAAVWEKTPPIAAAMRRHDLSGVQLAQLLTQASCAHQASKLLDLNELQADARLNLSRMAAAWDAGQGAAVTPTAATSTELDRLALEQAIAELVALDAYLTLLGQVPPANEQPAAAHWDDLQQFLPATELRTQLERIIEYDAPILQTGGSTP